MKPTMLLLITAFFILPGLALADSPFSSLQSANEKDRISGFTENMYSTSVNIRGGTGKMMLSDESNQQHIREAIVAMERNNQNNYWEALGKVECPICRREVVASRHTFST